MKKSKLWLVILSVSIMLSSCALAPNALKGESDIAAEQKLGMAPAEAPRMAMAEEVFIDEYATDSSFESTNVNTERIVIKNASLSIVVQDPSTAMESITDMAEGMGGFVVNSNLYKITTYQGLEVPNANITIRVPAEKLEQTLSQIKDLVEDPKIDILTEDISGQDVTSEVTDLESRLRNLEAAETQLLEILESAKETEDVITVFRELTSVREEIELIQGQIKYYRDSARLSAVSVFLQAKAALEPITIGGWQPGVEAQKALQALVNGGQLIVDFLIWLVIFAIPILAIIFLPIYFLIRFFRNRKQKKNQGAVKKEK
ncbi:MAG: DUF4349 domain-containing protein [Pelolinea sp.]|nr:DUF4349 domain-containing protein [Pelolinea sp.]